MIGLVAAMAPPAAAAAQSLLPAGSWTISPAAGPSLDPDADASPALAAAIGYTIVPNLSFEVEAGHTTFHGAMLYHFDGRFAPYVAAGALASAGLLIPSMCRISRSTRLK